MGAPDLRQTTIECVGLFPLQSADPIWNWHPKSFFTQDQLKQMFSTHVQNSNSAAMQNKSTKTLIYWCIEAFTCLQSHPAETKASKLQ